MADNAEIRERLFDGLRAEIISLADGPKVDVGAATPISPSTEESGDDTVDGSDASTPTAESIGRDQAIEAVLLDVFDSPLYGAVFAEALTKAQQQLVRAAELESSALLRDKGAITFDVRGLYPTIYERLAADERTASITQTAVPDTFGIFPVADRTTTIDTAWALIRSGPDLRTLTLLGAVLCLAAAIGLSDRRPSTAIQFGLGMVGLGVVVIVVIYLVRFMTPLLAGGRSSGAVVAVYSSVIGPLTGLMARFVILGGLLAVGGWIARFVWPDEWVYSSVSDERGVRSVMRRRSEAPVEPEASPAAAAGPVAYPGYGVPYGYPAPWATNYPGQPYPPGYVAPYPQGPYPLPGQHYYGAPVGQPTVPVIPVVIDAKSTQVDDLVPPPAPPLTQGPGSDGLPLDAARVVPRVVARLDRDELAQGSQPDRTPVPADQQAGDGAPGIDPDLESDGVVIGIPRAADGSGDRDDEPTTEGAEISG